MLGTPHRRPLALKTGIPRSQIAFFWAFTPRRRSDRRESAMIRDRHGGALLFGGKMADLNLAWAREGEDVGLEECQLEKLDAGNDDVFEIQE